MAKDVKYNDVNWPEGSDIAGERLATNGYYTGQHKGTPTQDALDGADNDAYYAERVTVRQGTLTQDDADTNFPTEKTGGGE